MSVHIARDHNNKKWKKKWKALMIRVCVVWYYYLQDWKRNDSNGCDESEDERKENEKERCYVWKKWSETWYVWEQNGPVSLLKQGAYRSNTKHIHLQHFVLGGNSSHSSPLMSSHFGYSSYVRYLRLLLSKERGMGGVWESNVVKWCNIMEFFGRVGVYICGGE